MATSGWCVSGGAYGTGACRPGTDRVVLDIALYVMVAVAVVVSVQVIGNLLVVALLVVPPATARLLTDRLGVMMLVATAISLLTWLLASRHGLLGRLRVGSARTGQMARGSEAGTPA